MIDERTQHYGLPLPHPENLLEEDVGRIRLAFEQVDGLIHAHATARQQSDAQMLEWQRRQRLRLFHHMDF
ncbi:MULTISPECIES: hypothetical protein [Tepidimonas]|jgi:hypothetical protein|uniref:Uncharacterized protein n=2 Tax=Tepidimonas TaxID=114248 RepID=A0A554XB78_9BURK|nr:MULTISPECIES: hypothetical protein [Tepidimonas]MCX8016694.1 hypothetical protein [Rhodocyclaceae bacterium]TCS98753.1 hypothetical protein EDC36_104177 [Tepidimonas ignava]TSE20321.1 hypothetical protein Tigna_01952 [Tepidimonas ignava]TSE33029.1 hypothetical protein Tchar_01910 [Tepidimonas charontis]